MTDLQIIQAIEAAVMKYAIAEKNLLTIEEASFFTGLTPRTLQQYVSDRKIGAFKPGKGHSAKLYFDKEDLEKYMRQNRVYSHDELESLATTHYPRKAS